MPVVSVIIPTYNRSKLVGEAVESVLRQRFTDFEVIVVDDGSSDDTGFVIGQISDERVKYCYKENGGQSTARNRGLALSTGRYVAYLDEDDLWGPEYLETVIGQLEANSDYGASYTHITVKFPDGSERDLSTADRYRSGAMTERYFDSSPPLMPSATCFRKSVWDGVFWDEAIRRGPDYDVFLRVSTKTQFLFVPGTTVIKRSMPDSISSAGNPIGPIDCANTLERFYFHFGGDKYVSSKLVRRKIGHRYRKAANVAYGLKNRQASIELFKRAIGYTPLDVRLYIGFLRAVAMSKKNQVEPDWQMPEPLPSYITVTEDR